MAQQRSRGCYAQRWYASEKIVGESFYSNTFRDRLITFDESTALPMETVEDVCPVDACCV